MEAWRRHWPDCPLWAWWCHDWSEWGSVLHQHQDSQRVGLAGEAHLCHPLGAPRLHGVLSQASFPLVLLKGLLRFLSSEFSLHLLQRLAFIWLCRTRYTWNVLSSIFLFLLSPLACHDCWTIILSEATQAYVPEFELGGSAPGCCCKAFSVGRTAPRPGCWRSGQW